MNRNLQLFALGCSWICFSCATSAMAKPGVGNDHSNLKKTSKGKRQKSESSRPKEILSQTDHTIKIGARTIKYQATAGTMFLRDDKDDPKASVFYVAYHKKTPAKQSQERPITFVFNGGPGSSAVWLHLGTFGPKRVVFEDAIHPAPPPYELVDNVESLLDVSDLVFIDPVGTGLSRTIGDTPVEDYLGVREDVKSVGEFIRLYTTRNDRWNSPKFLAGESYGTTRAAGLVNYLQNQGMYFSGVILVSSVLNFQTLSFKSGNDLGYVMFLPSYAATSAYHKRLKQTPADLAAFLSEVREFSRTQYAQALMEGARLPQQKRKKIIEKLSQYTGISPSYWERSDLRIPLYRFSKELTREAGFTIGRLDSRYTGLDRENVGESAEYDPSYSAIMGPYTATMNHYLRSELKVEEERKYQILNPKVGGKWKWQDRKHRGGYVNVADELAQAMRTNPYLQVFVANGYYDLATPFFATEYTVDHLYLPDHIRGNIQMGYYESGHMMYIHPPSLKQLKKDLRGLYRRAAEVKKKSSSTPKRP